jgi:signal transduction histidine kinase
VEVHPGNRPGATREQRLERLIEVGRALVSELDLEAVLERVLDAAQELTGAQYAALGVLDESRSELERFLTRGIDEETHRAIGDLPRGRGVLGVLITEPRPLRLTDVGEHSRSFGFPLGHPPMHSFLGVPILIHGHAYGNLYLTEKQAGEFDEEDENAVVILADWAAIAIENARAYSDVAGRRNELERAVATLEATTEIGRALAGETDLERILELVVKRGRALTDARAALVMLESGDELVLTSLAGELDQSLIGQRIPIEGTVAGQVLRSGRAERLADARGRLRFALAQETHADTGLFVPLLFRGRALGVLAAFDRLRDGPEFSGWDEHILSGFAASAAAGIATAQGANAQALRRSIAAAEQERTRWARDLHDETLQELAALKLLLGAARRTQDPGERNGALDQAADRIDVAVRALRNLITDLRPAVLDEYGLEPALEALAERVQQVSGTPVDLRIELDYQSGLTPGRLAQQVEDVLYRVVQEALSNVIKHSGATRAEVRLRESEETIEVVVRDEGAGFDADGESTGFGLLGMRERVALVEGALTIESAPGAGTSVRVSIPARRAEPPLRQVLTAEG